MTRSSWRPMRRCFSVAGSTHGNQAFCLAIGQPGAEVIITRTLHRSLLLGLVLAGLRPVWVRPQTMLSPREAFFAPSQTVPADAAVGRIGAELVAPYPPGVPVLAPGELITAEALAALCEVAAHGGRIAYAADPTLSTLQVVSGDLTAR